MGLITSKDQLPTEQGQDLFESLANGTPLEKWVAEIYGKAGGEDFAVKWAQQYPTEFMRVMLAVIPVAQHKARAAGKTENVVNLHVHPSLEPGPLDVVSEQ